MATTGDHSARWHRPRGRRRSTVDRKAGSAGEDREIYGLSFTPNKTKKVPSRAKFALLTFDRWRHSNCVRHHQVWYNVLSGENFCSTHHSHNEFILSSKFNYCNWVGNITSAETTRKSNILPLWRAGTANHFQYHVEFTSSPFAVAV